MAATYSITLRDDQYEFIMSILTQLTTSDTVNLADCYETDFLHDLIFNYMDKAAFTELP